MKKVIVAAKSDNNVIGKKGELIWDLPADLAFFYRTIAGHWLLSGRTSFDSTQGHEIFDGERKAIVVTSRESYSTGRGLVAHGISEAFNLAKSKGAASLYILGGSGIYKQTIDLADQLIITEVHAEFDGDAFFPEIEANKWKEVSRADHRADKNNPYDYSFVKYERV